MTKGSRGSGRGWRILILAVIAVALLFVGFAWLQNFSIALEHTFISAGVACLAVGVFDVVASKVSFFRAKRGIRISIGVVVVLIVLMPLALNWLLFGNFALRPQVAALYVSELIVSFVVLATFWLVCRFSR